MNNKIKTALRWLIARIESIKSYEIKVSGASEEREILETLRDAIETLTREKAELEDQIDALVAKVQSLSAHDGCACSFDRPDDICHHHSPKLAALRREALEVVRPLVEAKALRGVRSLVAGWNGEGREDGRHYDRHPARLGATLPKTNCGAVYELDEALCAARAFTEKHKDKSDAE